MTTQRRCRSSDYTTVGVNHGARVGVVGVWVWGGVGCGGRLCGLVGVCGRVVGCVGVGCVGGVGCGGVVGGGVGVVVWVWGGSCDVWWGCGCVGVVGVGWCGVWG
jgi:hypothetical protein